MTNNLKEFKQELKSFAKKVKDFIVKLIQNRPKNMV